MLTWSQPQDYRTWVARGLSLRGVLLFLMVLAVLISEIRFSWIEILTGHYLVATNNHRPESGSVWDQGRLKQVATQTLEQMVTRQITTRREASEATSLIQLVDGLEPSQGTMIAIEKFKDLYTKLPESMARNLFSPVFMLRISAEKSWDRVYLEKEKGQVGIYLLDRNNNVLNYTTIHDQRLQASYTEQPVRPGTLDEYPEFASRIYPADRFFMALDTLPPESQRGVISRPETLLKAQGAPIRVGISDEVNADLIRIGIEMETSLGKQIHLVKGKEWAVWQVRSLLEPKLKKRQFRRSPWPGHESNR